MSSAKSTGGSPTAPPTKRQKTSSQMSAYTVPQKREGSDDDDDGLPAALVSPDEQEMRIEIGELLGLPRVVRIVFATFGLTNWGGDQTACEKCLHSGASSIMFTNMGAAFFTLFHFIFGYSKEACYAICCLVILSNMCQVPAERYKFTDPLLVPFLRKNRSTVKKNANAGAWCVFGFVFYLLWVGPPLIGFASTRAFRPLLELSINASASNSTEGRLRQTGDAAFGLDMILGYYMLFSSPLCWFWMTGWFPAEGIYVQYNKHLTEFWVSEYADAVLTTLLDHEELPKNRLKKLSSLYKRRGKWLSQSLADHANPFHSYAFPAHLSNLLLSVVLLFPDVVGGLTNIDSAILPHPAVRITLGVISACQVTSSLFFFSVMSMSVPNQMFFEKIQNEILPDAEKFNTALECFPSGADDLWAWLRGQGLFLCLLGIPIDSALPGKVAAGGASLIGAATVVAARVAL